MLYLEKLMHNAVYLRRPALLAAELLSLEDPFPKIPRCLFPKRILRPDR